MWTCSQRAGRLNILRRAAALGRSISVSTKAALSNQLVTELAEVARGVERCERVLKIGVSISTKYNCKTLEPRAADYSARVEDLRLLRCASIPTCLVLKPILSDVPAEEYCEIISDVAGVTDCILIGDEYLDISSPRISLGTAFQRPVAWAVNKPTWPVILHLSMSGVSGCMQKASGFVSSSLTWRLWLR